MSTSASFTQIIQSSHGITPAWEETTGLNEWFAWVVNHIVGMMSVGNKTDRLQADATRLMLISAATPNRVQKSWHPFLTVLLQDRLMELVIDMPGSDKLVAFILEIIGFRARPSKGRKVQAHELDELNENIGRTRSLLQNMEDQNDRRCIAFALNAISLAAAKHQPPENMAHIVREVVNAMNCLEGKSSKSSYELIAEDLLACLNKLPMGDTLYVQSPLLEKLGTSTQVPDTTR